METKTQNLFLLMLQLSRIQDSRRMLDIFLESMNAIFNDVHFKLITIEEDFEFEIFEIKTRYNHFGNIAIEYGQTILPISSKSLISNAINMLAILLENRKQHEKLAHEKDRIKKDFLKQTEDLHAREEQYKALTENLEDMILRFNTDYSIVYANICAEQIFNIPRSFLLNKNIKDLDFPADQTAFWVNNLERVFAIGISINESHYLTNGNKKSVYDIRFVPEINEVGNVSFVLATARDITELKNKEKALYDSQWHLQQAQRIAKIGSWEWNLKYSKISWSDEMFHIFGLEPNNEIPNIKDLTAFFNEEICELIESFQKNPPETFDPFEIEVNIIRTDKQIRHCVVCGESIYSKSGKLKKVHGTLQDITDRKQMESEIKAAKLKAEESDKLKSAFLANMSHEIRTPLNGILGFSELLKRKNLPSDKRHFYTDIINSNGKQLLKIISDIIDISKIESGQIVIDRTFCSVSSILGELYGFFQNELKSREKSKIELIKDGDQLDQDLVLNCDEIRLRQILTNLLSNAVKFTSKGCIRFGYEIKRNFVEFYVKDTGIGIKQEYQSFVFERFRQANESVSREYGGTGLGLAICKSLVELMGGKIWVFSEEYQGSEFRFSLPMGILKNSTYPFSSDKNYLGDYSWPGKKILIVEDDLPSVQLMQETLEDSLAEIIHAEDGEIAIKLHGDRRPDIILMDIRLPKMNGLDAIRTIRGIDKNVAIIAITANAFVEDRMNCLSAGSNEYLSKPVDRDQLLSTIDRFI
jgi:PAS domain S-box-containing protein